MSASPIFSSTRKISDEKLELLRSLKAGDQLKITQTVRVGSRLWTTTVKGTYRDLNYLATGVTTDRVPEDDIIVPVLHFLKENKELSSIAIDDRTIVERVTE
ncbi:MAG: hypothetical protein R3B84_11280 [Zavarzinella sp.]